MNDTGKNIVLFGPGHVGKSTLAGYLKVSTDSSVNWDRVFRRFELELGSNFDNAQRYAYIVDTAKEERVRTGENEKSKGTSRLMHTVRMGGAKNSARDWVVIDTPGEQGYEKQRIKGMFYGDVGVFMIEAGKLLSKELIGGKKYYILQEFFAPLFAWREMGRQRVVVVFSKMDKIDFSENLYREALVSLREILGREELAVIPVSIDVDSGTSINIFNDAQEIPWYDGPSLVQALENIPLSSVQETERLQFFAAIDRKFNFDTPGLVVRAKILRGEVATGQAVRLIPVVSNSSESSATTGTVASIKEEKGESVTLARQGALVGIRISKLADKSAVLEPSTIILDIKRKACIGATIRLSIQHSGTEPVRLFEQIELVWFGKLIMAEVIDVFSGEDQQDFVVEAREGMGLAVPLEVDGSFENQLFMIKRPSIKDQKKAFQKVSLAAVLDIEGIYLLKDVADSLGENVGRDKGITIDGNFVRIEAKKGVANKLRRLEWYLEGALKSSGVPLRDAYKLRYTDGAVV